jgi:tRNA (cytidine32/uridine32-2'-O)-methyltransferase
LGVDPAAVDVVLVRPRNPANVAAACRALKNMGLRSLRLVGEDPGLGRPEARNLAYGAWDLLDSARFFSGLQAAVADATFVAGTSGREDAAAWSPRRFTAEGGIRAAGGRTALVFGPEASGLTAGELSSCHARVRIAADPEQPSLNLAQAVLILAYEIRLSHDGGPETPAPPRASAGELEAALGELRGGPARHRVSQPRQPGCDPGRAASAPRPRGAHAARGKPAARSGPADPLGRPPDCGWRRGEPIMPPA